MKELETMIPPITGGCLCGQVTYVASAAPVWSANCHCRSCQRLSGAPFVSAFSVPAESFEVRGETTRFLRRSDSGHLVTTTHCAACGSRVHAQSAGNTALMNIFAATLDDVTIFRPLSNVYLSEAAAWVDPPAVRFNFPKMPHRPERDAAGG